MRSLFKYKDLYFGMLTLGFTISLAETAAAQPAAGEASMFAWKVEPSYRYRNDGKPGRSIRLHLKNRSYKNPVIVKVTCNSITETNTFREIDTLDHLRILLPAGAGVAAATTAELIVTMGEEQATATVFVPRSKQWTVFIYPHSHLDIGYTALPADVKKLQLRNIDVGIDIAAKTKDYPGGARFTWNPEATWVVRHYLQQASPVQKQKFIAAVKNGWLQVDGGHSNSNLSTCSDEELVHFFKNASYIQRVTGMPITTMVQVDVPGVAWGLVTVAAQFGIKRFINFPNTFDLRKQWEHKPFYWLGPDGKTKMLFLQGFPYGIGYTIKGSKYGLGKIQTFTNDYDRVSTGRPMEHFLHPFIFNETEKLEEAGSPYDLFAMTWSMADNCVIDADLPDAVRQWNSIYAYPKLVIAGAKDILDAWEKKYASIIPTYTGDFTEFWTNGLGSDAASVGTGREAKEELVQAEILSSVLGTENYPAEKMNAAWENHLLSAEHTWGAQDPTSLLAEQVERIKAGYFIHAKKESEALIAALLAPFEDTTAPGFAVINTLSWSRNAIVTLTKEQSRFGDVVVDEKNCPVLSQRLTTGELIFRAEQVPALGSKWYRVMAKSITGRHPLLVTTTTLRNDRLSIKVSPVTGNVTSVKNINNGYEYVDSVAGLNSYQYITGVYNGVDKPNAPVTVSNVSITIKEQGPLLVSLQVTSKAEGVTGLTREIKLYQGSPVVHFSNTFNKIATRTKEGMHFGFAFNLPGATGHIDMPWSIVTPGVDQLDGANKNWFTFQRWVDISSKQKGITWTAIQSPLLEWGSLSGNILDGARQYWLWQTRVPASSTIYSWPLNNHWDTNFPLQQGGMMQQQYSFMIHDGYDAVTANRFGMEAHRPVIVVQAKKNINLKTLVRIDNPRLVISTLRRTNDNKAILLRVRSVSDKKETLTLGWPAGHPREIIQCTPDELPDQPYKNNLEIEPYGMTNLRLVF